MVLLYYLQTEYLPDRDWETIRSLFRGKRINDIIIESVSPPNTESGTTIEFDNNFTSASIFLDYYRDLKE